LVGHCNSGLRYPGGWRLIWEDQPGIFWVVVYGHVGLLLGLYCLQGGVIVFVTSHWAHLYGQMEQLPAYKPIAESKYAGEQALRWE
jgi:hypothetical protein